MNLCDEFTIRALLERHGFHFSKSMGQNFLIDPEVPARIAASSEADRSCGVLEIVPGIGPLTAELAQLAGRAQPMSLGPVLTIDQRHPLQIEPVIQWLVGTIAGQHSGFTDYAYSS